MKRLGKGLQNVIMKTEDERRNIKRSIGVGINKHLSLLDFEKQERQKKLQQEINNMVHLKEVINV